MNQAVLTILLLGPLGISAVFLWIRFFLGPTSLDRLVAFESLTIVFLCSAAAMGVLYQTPWFHDAILVLSLVGFLSTVAVCLKIVEGARP